MFIDLHCDTASRLYYEKKKLSKNNISVDIEKLNRGKALCQFFAYYINLKDTKEPYNEFLNMHNNFMNEIKENSNEITIIRKYDDFKLLQNERKIGALLTIEEGGVLEGKINNLKKAYDLGIRAITLTWNYENQLGFPNKDFKDKDKGLKELGEEFVYYMEELGIIPDCSHLSDKGFYDLIKICKKPFMATHSNARSITNHPRNLTDDMIRLLGEKGGVMGINFCSEFLGESKISRIDDMIKHIKHIENIGGIDVISLGSDFDGIENNVEISNPSEFYKLAFKLNKANFSDDKIDKIFYKNSLRVLKECI